MSCAEVLSNREHVLNTMSQASCDFAASRMAYLREHVLSTMSQASCDVAGAACSAGLLGDGSGTLEERSWSGS